MGWTYEGQNRNMETNTNKLQGREEKSNEISSSLHHFANKVELDEAANIISVSSK
jgi:hypothetical protein